MHSFRYFSDRPPADLTRADFKFYLNAQQLFDGQSMSVVCHRTLSLILNSPLLTTMQAISLGAELGYARKLSTVKYFTGLRRVLLTEQERRSNVFPKFEDEKISLRVNVNFMIFSLSMCIPLYMNSMTPKHQ
jgi:hypothetical protein